MNIEERIKKVINDEAGDDEDLKTMLLIGMGLYDDDYME